MNDVFADIFNVLVFGGKQVVTPDSLEDITGISQYKADDLLLHEQERDTYKLWKGQGINLVIVRVEKQLFFIEHSDTCWRSAKKMIQV